MRFFKEIYDLKERARHDNLDPAVNKYSIGHTMRILQINSRPVSPVNAFKFPSFIEAHMLLTQSTFRGLAVYRLSYGLTGAVLAKK